ncbi:hypothetical protein BDV06DRAFT_228867 [Aspergillus oleicola]
MKTNLDCNNLTNLHNYFVITRASTNSPLNSQLELEVFLEWWAGENWKGELGSIQPLWELLRILKLVKPKDLVDRLCKINNCLKDTTEQHLLTTYLVEDIESLSEWTTEVDQLLQGKRGDDLLRYKIKVIRNTFLWANCSQDRHLNWAEILFGDYNTSLVPTNPPLEEVLRQMALLRHIDWLAKAHARIFWEGNGRLDDKDLSNLNGLWEFLRNNSEIRVKYAFRLAIVGAKANWGNVSPWFHFNTLVKPLVMTFATMNTPQERLNCFLRSYLRYMNEPDDLGITWTQQELGELANVCEAAFCKGGIKEHLLYFPTNPARAVTSVLPRVLPEDIIYHNKIPPTVS